PIHRIEQRILEAEKLGFRKMIVPANNLKGLSLKNIEMEIIPVKKVEEAFKILLKK
ncbi:MAG TPA: DNA repair protein RadA, partial [Paludibacteraceae bacterium]|nr:DNA repair protein RadA [Paludibacteraceae bacterium]